MYDAKHKIQLLDQILAIASDPNSKTYEALQHDLLAHKLADQPLLPGSISHLMEDMVREIRSLKSAINEMAVEMDTDKKNLNLLYDALKSQYIPDKPNNYYGGSYRSNGDPFYYW